MKLADLLSEWSLGTRSCLLEHNYYIYNNVRKRSRSKRSEIGQRAAKPELTHRKMLLCIWWNWQGVIYHAQLDVCYRQLHSLKLVIGEKRIELADR